MALILNLETATTVCSVALAQNGKFIAEKEIDNGYSHSQNLAIFIKEVLAETGKKPTDLNAIAISKGPGSYTGLRIGVSTAKGLCYALNIPLIAVPTLEVMVESLSLTLSKGEGMLLCPMLDARRMEVYTALYDIEGNEKKTVCAEIIDESAFQKELENNMVYFFGNGAEKCKSVLGNHSNANFIDEVYPSAKSMAALSQTKFDKKEFEDVAYFEPFYLKDFVATTPKKLI